MANDEEAAKLPEAEGATVTAIKDAKVAKEKRYGASIYSSEPIKPEFAEIIFKIEKLLNAELWLLLQAAEGEGDWNDISEEVYCGFRGARQTITPNARIGLMIHSPGGRASYAYKIARLFQRRTPEFFTIVPLYAKSAATLMALGGKEVVMGVDAELGPLDVQLYDPDKEEWDSALNAVQSLERLNAYALSAFDQAMFLFLARTRKKADFLLPSALNYATAMLRPLVEKIDTIELTRRSRELKVAEDYAVRLMKPNYAQRDYLRIASNLVEKYSTHDFNIDRAEAGKDGSTSGRPPVLGLHTVMPSDEVERLFDDLVQYLERITVIGRIAEVSP